MRHTWAFGQQLVPSVVSGRSLKETLIEYDGPQLCILEKDSDEFLALRIDEDGAGVRWLEAPITSVEFVALMAGELPIRDVLLKPDVILVENSRLGEAVRAWELEPARIPSQVLPRRAALLPRYVRASYKSDLEPETLAEFHVSTKSMRGSRISFSRLSDMTHAIQQLWNSIASTMGAESLTLHAAAFAHGSFKVRVEVENPDLLAKVANAYRGLTRATYDETELVEALSKSSEPVRQNYSKYLRTLDLNQLDVLAHWHEDGGERAAFVGYAGAHRTRQAITTTPKEDPKKKLLTLDGYLEGFAGGKRYFEFYEDGTGRRIDGRIHKDLREVPLHDEVHLGHRKRYRVEIESALLDGLEKFTLLALSALD